MDENDERHRGPSSSRADEPGLGLAWLDWNDTTSDYPREACIQQLFEAQAERTPDAVALVLEDDQLTYGELNERANRLVDPLRELGVGPDVPEGLCAERSFEMVAGLLGILKAGGAYVPLDPEYPEERLEWMLQDTEAPVVLVQRHLEQALPEHAAAVLYLDDDRGPAGADAPGNPECRTTAENLAYVMYTSGSTGRPKGVEVRHRGVVRLLFGVDYATLDESRTFLHMAPISFDASTFELWGALLHGARCVLLSKRDVPLADLRNVT